MRIAHVITRMIVGGAQENTLFTCKDLVALHGDDVLLITGPSHGPEGELLRRDAAPGVVIRELDSLRRSIHPWRDLVAYREIRRELRAFRPDVVHTHSAKGGVLGRLAAWSLRAPAVVHTVHGAPFHPYQSALARNVYRWCEWYAAGKCHHLVSVADAMTDLLVEARVAPREKFTTILSGMEVGPFLESAAHREPVRRELGLAPDDVVIGKIARLFPLKGHEFLLRAAPEIVRRSPRVKFLLVGDGVLREQVEQEAAAAGIADRLVFAGLVPPERIPALLAAMDVLVHTSLREGLARALPQALLAGRPVVSYDIDGAREVVLPDRTGLLLPPRSIEPLVEALTRLANDPALRERLGAEGRRLFSEPFRHETMTRRLRELYERLLTQLPERRRFR